LQSLLQKAKEAGAEARAEKIAAGRFTLVDFCEQIQSIQQMGPLTQMIEMIPGLGRMKIPTQALEIQEARMSKWKYIIDSMTPEERAGEETIDANRVVRIARGSGTTESEVRELLKNYNQVKKLMRMAGGKKFKRGPFAQLARQLGMGALK
jgi:signal recognition particle subunit SRP54